MSTMSTFCIISSRAYTPDKPKQTVYLFLSVSMYNRYVCMSESKKKV